MDSLREFFVSSSGLVPVRQGLGLGWVISALTWVAILISPREAAACGQTIPPEDPVDSPGCEAATDGELKCKTRDCWLDENCNVRCSSWYCCVC
ncbi:MAG: hypothetical protein F4X75_22180 [Gemmatimonadetes bacterium]|nr:hypothetical protein [Gemmatimonadota bacterium]